MKRILKALLALTILLALIVPGALAESRTAKVLVSRMSVYDGTGAGAALLGRLTQGSGFAVTSISGGWARVSLRGRVGYARLSQMIFDEAISASVRAQTQLTFVTKSSMRKKVAYRATLAKGTRVDVVGVNGAYLLIKSAGGGALGYVKASALKKN